MPDTLTTALQRLRNSTLVRKEVADRAAVVVASLEEFLTKKCHFSTEGFVLVSQKLTARDEVVEKLFLGFARHGDAFRVVVNSFDQRVPEGAVEAWADSPLTVKLDTANKLPELLAYLAQHADAQAAAVLGSTEKVTQAIAAALAAGGK